MFKRFHVSREIFFINQFRMHYHKWFPERRIKHGSWIVFEFLKLQNRDFLHVTMYRKTTTHQEWKCYSHKVTMKECVTLSACRDKLYCLTELAVILNDIYKANRSVSTKILFFFQFAISKSVIYWKINLSW